MAEKTEKTKKKVFFADRGLFFRKRRVYYLKTKAWCSNG